MLMSMPVTAEMAPLRDAARENAASHIVTGTVVRKTERSQLQGSVVHFNGEAEIEVDSVQKGKELNVGERVVVRY